ncbi:hypothetical protein ACLB1G_17670 [Oxalobacteraceae bacterium A2-2]
MTRSRHPKKEIEAALKHAELHGWLVIQGAHHAWGAMYCPFNSKDCRGGEHCITQIWSTPRSAGGYARNLRRVVDNCTQLNP